MKGKLKVLGLGAVLVLQTRELSASISPAEVSSASCSKQVLKVLQAHDLKPLDALSIEERSASKAEVKDLVRPEVISAGRKVKLMSSDKRGRSVLLFTPLEVSKGRDFEVALNGRILDLVTLETQPDRILALSRVQRKGLQLWFIETRTGRVLRKVQLARSDPKDGSYSFLPLKHSSESTLQLAVVNSTLPQLIFVKLTQEGELVSGYRMKLPEGEIVNDVPLEFRNSEYEGVLANPLQVSSPRRSEEKEGFHFFIWKKGVYLKEFYLDRLDFTSNTGSIVDVETEVAEP